MGLNGIMSIMCQNSWEWLLYPFGGQFFLILLGWFLVKRPYYTCGMGLQIWGFGWSRPSRRLEKNIENPRPIVQFSPVFFEMDMNQTHSNPTSIIHIREWWTSICQRFWGEQSGTRILDCTRLKWQFWVFLVTRFLIVLAILPCPMLTTRTQGSCCKSDLICCLAKCQWVDGMGIGSQKRE